MATNRQVAHAIVARLDDLDRRVKNISRQPQLAHASIEDGALQVFDDDGTPTAIIGKQHDGTFTAASVSGPIPPTPSAPVVEAGRASLTVTWDGVFLDENGVPSFTVPAPMDFSRVEVHVSTDPNFSAEYADTLVGTTETARGGRVVVDPLPAVAHYVRLVTRSLSGKASPASPVSSMTPLSEGSIVLDKIDAAQTIIENAEAATLATGQTLGGKLAANDTAQAGLAADLSVVKNTDLPALNNELTAATGRLTTAEGDISSAFTRLTSAENDLTTIPGQIDAAKQAAIQAASLDAIAQAEAAEARAAATAALDAQAKADAAEAAALAAAKTYAEAQASGASASAIDAAALDAQQKADAAKAAAISAAALDAKAQSEAAEARATATAATDAQTKADAAKNAAITAAATDAQAKADAAKQAAIDAAALDAQTKANAAKDAAVSAAALDATAKAEAAEARAAQTAALDAQAKADAAEADALAAAKTYAELQATNAGDAVLAAAKTDAQTKADAAKAAAISAAALDATAKAETAESNAAATAAADAQVKADAAKQAAIDAAAIDANNKAAQALTDAKSDATLKVDALGNTKNATYYSTADPGTLQGTRAGDIYRKIDASENIIGEWQWTGTTWKARKLTDAVLTGLDVGKLSAGSATIADAVAQKIAASTATFQKADIGNLTVTGTTNLADAVAQRIAANTGSYIQLDVSQLTAASANMGSAVVDKVWANLFATHRVTADQALIGFGGNLVANGSGEFGDNSGWADKLTWDATDKPAGLPGSFRSTAASGTVSTGANPGHFFDVEPSTEYLVEFWIKADKANSRFYMELRDQAGSHGTTNVKYGTELGYPSGGYPFGNGIVPTTWTKFYAVATTTATANKLRIGSLYFNHPNGTEQTATVWLAGLSIKRRVGASLIVNNGIVTDHLNVTEDMTVKLLAAHKVQANEVAADVMNGKLIVGADIRTADSPANTGGVQLYSGGIRAWHPTTKKQTVNINGTANWIAGEFRTSAPGEQGLVLLNNSGNAEPGIWFAIDGSTNVSHAAIYADSEWNLNLRGKSDAGGSTGAINVHGGLRLMSGGIGDWDGEWMVDERGNGNFWTATMIGNISTYNGKLMFLGENGSYGLNFVQSDYPVRFAKVNSTAGQQIEAGKLRLLDTGDASETSTGHAFQIGATGGSHLRMDVNELLSRNGNAWDGFYIVGSSTSLEGKLTGSGSWNSRLLGIGGADIGLKVGSNGTTAYVNSSSLYTLTGSGSANLYVTSGGFVYRSTSTRRNKVAIESIDDSLDDAILSLAARTWYDRAESEEYAAYMDAVDRGEDPGELMNPGPLRRIPGMIAEEVEEAGLTEFVQYDEDGIVQGLMYDRLGVALIPVVARLRARIEALENHIKSTT